MLLKDVLESLDYMTYVRLVHVNGPKRHAICFPMNGYYDENLHDDVNDAINKLLNCRVDYIKADGSSKLYMEVL